MQALSVPVVIILEEYNIDIGNVDINPQDTPQPERRLTVYLTIIMVFKSHFNCGTNSARIMLYFPCANSGKNSKN